MESANPPAVRRRIRKRKACVQCTRSKRKCDKTSPQCNRCIERGDPCEYQLLAHVQHSSSEATIGRQPDSAAQEEESEDENITIQDAPQSGTPRSYYYPSSTGGPLPTSHPQPQHNPSIASSSSSAPNSNNITNTAPPSQNLSHLGLSFLTPSSWRREFKLDSPDGAPSPRITEDDLPLFISHLKSWMATWISTGHCPMMHRSLYRGHMPECIQDAFTTLAAYNGATPGTRCSILRIIRDRAEKLISSQPVGGMGEDVVGEPELNRGGVEGTEGEEVSLPAPCVILDTPTHLARTTALFVYQLLRLFDGDIRSRAQAEEQMGTLHAWASQMLESARLDCVTAEYLVASGGSAGGNLSANDFTLVVGSAAMTDPSLTWQAWILAESIRRVFLMAEYMQSVYLTIKRGWSACSGGVPFTPKAGLWDAASAWAWVNKAQCELGKKEEMVAPEGKLPQLLHSMNTWIALKKNQPEDVDEFTHVLLGLCDTRLRWGTG